MGALSKEEAVRVRAAILAKEQGIKEEWCALEGRKWDLPQLNPLNADFYECPMRCNRCGITAKLVITVDAPAPAKAGGK